MVYTPKATERLDVGRRDIVGRPYYPGHDDVALPPMVDAVRNAEAPWDDFSPQAYWRRNYMEPQPEDLEIIDRVSNFFIGAFADRSRAQRAIDVGSGPNLYPALLMLPWTDQILLSDLSVSNVGWLRHCVLGDDSGWDWQPFWDELGGREGYNQIGDPRKKLHEACSGEPGLAGIEQLSVFDLPRAQWELGTMFFVAESITQVPAEFRAALTRFIGALTPGAPFAAAFMGESKGYGVDGVRYPALPITPADVGRHFVSLGVRDLSVHVNQTEDRVRTGYTAMIVATGFAGGF